MGTEIDGGGAIRGIRPRVHPDAELVAEAIERLPASERRVILHHARHANRPDWLPLAAPLVAVKRPSDTRGRYRHVIAEAWEPTPKQSEVAALYFQRGISLLDPHGRRRITEEERGFRFRVFGDATRQLLVRWCPLEPRHSDVEIVETNEAYLFWHGAMVALGEALARASLRNHTLAGFTAPERPWNAK
ncbi:hypothetical protein J2847_006852 [Azospirillum agricola]|uniref:hypothetical protein n=1 Tax=Azospirillum agricola TaxID=1720247 RepID=UPI001AE877D0|nr:hypothetical protein [Azospirillum agricola]MBP2233510.1 hypothetical protein [Azospirillum agricola]